MRYFAILAVVIAVVAGFAYDASRKDAEQAKKDCLVANWSACLARQEPKNMLPQGDVVERTEDHLTIIATNGSKVELRNETKCGGDDALVDYDHCYSYVYLGRIGNDRAHLLTKDYYESRQYILVDAATGRIDEIGEKPYFSPSADQFVIVGHSVGADETFDHVQVWKWTPQEIMQDFDWTYPSSQWDYDFRAWDGEDKVILNAGLVDGIDDASKPKDYTASLDHTTGSWSLIEPAP